MRTGSSTYNGEECVLGGALMLTGENSRLVARAVNEKLKAIQARLPAGVIVTPRLREKMGQYLKEGDLICEIEDPDSMELEVPLDDYLLGYTKRTADSRQPTAEPPIPGPSPHHWSGED